MPRPGGSTPTDYFFAALMNSYTLTTASAKPFQKSLKNRQKNARAIFLPLYCRPTLGARMLSPSAFSFSRNGDLLYMRERSLFALVATPLRRVRRGASFRGGRAIERGDGPGKRDRRKDQEKSKR